MPVQKEINTVITEENILPFSRRNKRKSNDMTTAVQNSPSPARTKHGWTYELVPVQKETRTAITEENILPLSRRNKRKSTDENIAFQKWSSQPPKNPKKAPNPQIQQREPSIRDRGSTFPKEDGTEESPEYLPSMRQSRAFYQLDSSSSAADVDIQSFETMTRNIESGHASNIESTMMAAKRRRINPLGSAASATVTSLFQGDSIVVLSHTSEGAEASNELVATSQIAGNTADENEDLDASQTTIYKGLDVPKKAPSSVQTGKDVEIFRESFTTKDINPPTIGLLNEFEESLKTRKSIHVARPASQSSLNTLSTGKLLKDFGTQPLSNSALDQNPLDLQRSTSPVSPSQEPDPISSLSIAMESSSWTTEEVSDLPPSDPANLVGDLFLSMQLPFFSTPSNVIMQSEQVNESHATHEDQKSLTLISGSNLDHQTTSQIHQESYVSHNHPCSATLAEQSKMDLKTVSSLQSNQGITEDTRAGSMPIFQEPARELEPPSQFFPPTDLPQTLNSRIASHINSVQNRLSNSHTTPSSHITTTSVIQQLSICIEDKGTASIPSFTKRSLSSSASTLPDPSQTSLERDSDQIGSPPLPQSGVDPGQKSKITTVLDHNSESDSELSDVDIDSDFAEIEIRLTAASTQLEQSASSEGSRRVSTRPRTVPCRFAEETTQKQTSNSKVSAEGVSSTRNRSSLPTPSALKMAGGTPPSGIRTVSVASLAKLTMLTFIIDLSAQTSKQRIIQTSPTSH